MKSIFILGASRLQVPAIIKAKEKGLYVYVLDYDPNAVGIHYADKFLEISTIDKEAVLQAAIEYNPDFIITSTSDMPVRTVSWVCEKLGKKTIITQSRSLNSGKGGGGNGLGAGAGGGVLAGRDWGGVPYAGC